MQFISTAYARGGLRGIINRTIVKVCMGGCWRIRVDYGSSGDSNFETEVQRGRMWSGIWKGS
jgi:hypothetical protein